MLLAHLHRAFWKFLNAVAIKDVAGHKQYYDNPYLSADGLTIIDILPGMNPPTKYYPFETLKNAIAIIREHAANPLDLEKSSRDTLIPLMRFFEVMGCSNWSLMQAPVYYTMDSPPQLYDLNILTLQQVNNPALKITENIIPVYVLFNAIKILSHDVRNSAALSLDLKEFIRARNFNFSLEEIHNLEKLPPLAEQLKLCSLMMSNQKFFLQSLQTISMDSHFWWQISGIALYALDAFASLDKIGFVGFNVAWHILGMCLLPQEDSKQFLLGTYFFMLSCFSLYEKITSNKTPMPYLIFQNISAQTTALFGGLSKGLQQTTDEMAFNNSSVKALLRFMTPNQISLENIKRGLSAKGFGH